MSLTAPALAPAVQELIDVRLDALDRVLLVRTPRADRLAIVQEVEAQIHQMLQEVGMDEPTPEQVLAVLARLDPPEAYLAPREAGGGHPPAPAPRRLPAAATAPDQPAHRRMARVSAVLGIVALVLGMLFPVAYLLAALAKSEVLMVLGCGLLVLLSLPSAIVAVVLAAIARRSGGWALAGLICGIVALVLMLLIGVFALLLLVAN